MCMACFQISQLDQTSVQLAHGIPPPSVNAYRMQPNGTSTLSHIPYYLHPNGATLLGTMLTQVSHQAHICDHKQCHYQAVVYLRYQLLQKNDHTGKDHLERDPPSCNPNPDCETVLEMTWFAIRQSPHLGDGQLKIASINIKDIRSNKIIGRTLLKHHDIVAIENIGCPALRSWISVISPTWPQM